MDSHHENGIAAVLQNLSILSPTQFAWYGMSAAELPSAVLEGLTAEECRDHQQLQLQNRLYSSYYCFGHPRPFQERTAFEDTEDAAFVNRLSVANSGRGSWMGGWTVRANSGEQWTVQGRDLQLVAPAKDCRRINDRRRNQCDTPIRPGDPIEVRLPKEQRGISPGFYLVHGDQGLNTSADIIRVYWNIAAEGAAELTAQITDRFNQDTIPFRFKVVNNPRRFDRCDSAVLYIPRSAYSEAIPLLALAYQTVQAHMRKGTTAFALPLAKGLGLAEDPGNGESFGWHRCGLVAQGILDAVDQRQNIVEDQIHCIQACFEKAGIQWRFPFRNPASDRQYPFPIINPDFNTNHHWSVSQRQSEPSSEYRVGRPRTHILDASDDSSMVARIADRLCETALWNDNRCTWLGPELESEATQTAKRNGLHSLVNASVYDGLAGIALFLGEAAVKTQKQQHLQTAVGAIHQALETLDTIPESTAAGLHSGWLGVAAVCHRLGQTLDQAPLRSAATRLAERAQPALRMNTQFDIISGAAGGILAALSIFRDTREELYVDIAHELAHQLDQSKTVRGDRYSWQSIGRSGRDLTGFSHGTAGVALALAELAHESGGNRWADLAAGAVNYERASFSHEHQNWPDYRTDRGRIRRLHGQPSYPSSWCHGAAGIALARHRMASIVSDPEIAAELKTATDATLQWVRGWLDAEKTSLCLCHGMAGNLEIIRPLVEKNTCNENLILRAENAVLTQSVQAFDRGEQTIAHGPGLMVGDAGLGMYFLRKLDADIPSPLCFTPSGRVS